MRGNIVLVDKHPNFVSFVTILYWMFTGKEDRYLKSFQNRVFQMRTIDNCKTFGSVVEKYLVQEIMTGCRKNLFSKKQLG
jgi:hypothetical protein